MKVPTAKTIECCGTPFEIGLAHGTSAADEVHSNVETYTYFFGETAKLSWAEARERAVTHFLPTIEKEWPDIVDEMRGIAQGAGRGLTLADIVTLNVRTEIAFTNYTDGCTSIGQQAEDGTMYLAQNWDMIPELQRGLVFLHIHPAGSDIAIKLLGEAGIVGKIGMNSAGFGLCMNALRSGTVNRNNMPVHIMSRRLLQFATSYDSAAAIIKDFGLAASINYILADKNGNFADLECSPRGNFYIPPVGNFVSHANHFYAASRPRELIDHPARDSFCRLNRIQSLTESDKERGIPVTFESLRARLSDEQDSPPAICRSVPPGAVGIDRIVTLGTIMMDLSNCRGKVIVGRPCEDLPVVDWTF